MPNNDKTRRGYRRFIVPAGAESAPQNLSGANWYKIKSLSASGLLIQLNGVGAYSPVTDGDNDNGLIDFVNFKNPTAVNVEVELIFGNGFSPNLEGVTIINPSFTLDANTQSNLKDVNASIVGEVTVTPKSKNKAVIIAEKIATSKSYQDILNLSIYNSGAVNITVSGMTLEAGETVSFQTLNGDQLYSDIIVDASAATAQATIIGAK